MTSKVLGITLFTLTVAAVIYYPAINAQYIEDDPPIDPVTQLTVHPVIDVVFVLDTTGSMSGLIQAAKEKIWSIASTMANAQTSPQIRVGLVAYRDRGDSYITRVVDLSSDLDSVYATLMEFEAGGGGDGPESVNKALHDAVHEISWSDQSQAYQVVFLVGDAPPHMDYQEVQYPEIVADALKKGIVINTIQCGGNSGTLPSWQQIASLGHGAYFQVEQAGNAVAYSTPYDEEIASLSARLDDTRMYYGSAEEKTKGRMKRDATDKLNRSASVESLARRAAFNATQAGKINRLGKNELIDDVLNGAVDLDELEPEALPEALKPMAPAEQLAAIEGIAAQRQELEEKIHTLSDDRNRFLSRKVKEAGGRKDSLDQIIYDAVSDQAAAAGLVYEEGPSY